MTEMMDLYGVGDHGGGPTRAILDEGIPLGSAPGHVTPKYRVRHGAELLLGDRKADCARQPGVELPVDCQGLHASAGGCGQGEHSHLEERAVLRVPPRRDDHAGQPQAQYARG